ncbi:kinase-like domain-containing protein [Apiospora phragmitis]|uniref:Kinase-like domain-containing protein n=1 Tax=Apiospora phragmitis TaxID=2905665 RepID=A0ABR1VT03_9PEZI
MAGFPIGYVPPQPGVQVDDNPPRPPNPEPPLLAPLQESPVPAAPGPPPLPEFFMQPPDIVAAQNEQPQPLIAGNIPLDAVAAQAASAAAAAAGAQWAADLAALNAADAAAQAEADRVEALANATRGELMAHFTIRRRTPWFQFRRFLGQGAYGVAALVADERAEGPPRLLVVKRGVDERGQVSIRREIYVLELLRGGMHSVQLLAYRDRLVGSPFWEIRDLFRNRGRYLNRLVGPTLVTEYVENGTFEDLYDKTKTWPEPVPNRILWRILLCGIRACIGMAWPTFGEHKAPGRIEVIDNRPPLQHGSAEHDVVPAMKLIDFGLARDATTGDDPPQQPEKGAFWNTRDCAGLVMALIAKAYNWQPRPGAFMDGYIETDAWDLYMPGAEFRYPTLDPPLRELIGRMMAKNEAHRVPLSVCLAVAEEAVRNHTAADYPDNWQGETDEAIMEYVQRAFLNGSAQPQPPQAPPPQPTQPPPPPQQQQSSEEGSQDDADAYDWDEYMWEFPQPPPPPPPHQQLPQGGSWEDIDMDDSDSPPSPPPPHQHFLQEGGSWEDIDLNDSDSQPPPPPHLFQLG